MIKLEKEKETLLIPLYGKAMESRKKSPLLYDKKAVEVVKNIEYDFDSLKIPAKTNTMMCLRAKLFDNFAKNFLLDKKNTVVLNLGCGLDSRFNRLDATETDWYDLDFREVIEIRRHFFTETGNYHLIPSSVTDLGWINKVPTGREHYLVIAEGMFMYLKEADIKLLLDTLVNRIGIFTLIFDAFSLFTAKRVKNHPSIKKTGADIFWGISKNDELTQWNPNFIFLKNITFTSNEETKNLGFWNRLAFKTADLFPIARNAQRILVYSIGH